MTRQIRCECGYLEHERVGSEECVWAGVQRSGPELLDLVVEVG